MMPAKQSLSSLCVAFVILSVLSSVKLCEGADENNNTIDKNEMGMEVLFDMVNFFLGDVVHKERISDSFLNLSTLIKNGHINDDQLTDWEEWADYLMGYSICVAIGVLFIVVMPITGLIFCCCRCSGKCGAQKKIYESKRAKCKRGSYCTILLILNTATLVGVICIFMNNALLREHLENEDDQGIIGNMKYAINSMDSYVGTTVDDAAEFIHERFDGITKKVLDRVNNSADHAIDSVLTAINISQSMDEAKDINREANETKQELDQVGELLGNLQDQSDDLKTNLSNIRSNIVTACGTGGSCTGFNPADYDTDANFTSLGLMKNETEKVSDSLQMGQYIEQAEDEIETEKGKARGDVQDQVNGASSSIDKVNELVEQGIKDLREKKDEALNFVDGTVKDLDDANNSVREHYEVIYYIGIGVGCCYLLIVFFYYVGILFGLCGEKPGDGAPCCNTGAGASCLMAGVVFTFLFSWILMLLCVVLFIVGGPAYTEVCRYFVTHDPSEFKVFDVTLREGFDFFGNFSPTFSVSQSIRDCQENKALYSSLELDYVVDLDEIMNIKDVVSSLDDLRNSKISLQNITFISPALKKKLNELANAGLDSINFTEYFTELQKELTKTRLPVLAQATRGYAQASSGPEKLSLMNSADELDWLHANTVEPMEHQVTELEQVLIQLQAKSSISSRVNKLTKGLEGSQEEFNSKKDDYVKEEIEVLADDIIDFVNNSLNMLKKEIRQDMFPCGPLSTALYLLTDSVCVLGVDPVNGLWFSYGCCLFFFVPCLIFAVLLASQYRREHEYDKEFDDPNYSMYGHNQDTIPLTRLDRGGPYPGQNQGYYPSHPSSSSGAHANVAYLHDKHYVGPHMQPPPYEHQPGIAAYAPPDYGPVGAPPQRPMYPPPSSSRHHGGGYSYPY